MAMVDVFLLLCVQCVHYKKKPMLLITINYCSFESSCALRLMCIKGGWMDERCFRPLFYALSRLNWAGDNLG